MTLPIYLRLTSIRKISNIFPHYKLTCSIGKFFLKVLNCLNTMMKSLQRNAVPQSLCLTKSTEESKKTKKRNSPSFQTD